MALDRKRLVGIGGLALIVLAGLSLFMMTFEPSQDDARAFLRKILVADGTIHALGQDRAVIRLDSSRVAHIDFATCKADQGERRFGVRHVPNAANRYICRFTIRTLQDERYEIVLRANRVASGGPAETAIAGSLVDPSRYRVGRYALQPVGLKEAEILLGVAPADE